MKPYIRAGFKKKFGLQSNNWMIFSKLYLSERQRCKHYTILLFDLCMSDIVNHTWDRCNSSATVSFSAKQSGSLLWRPDCFPEKLTVCSGLCVYVYLGITWTVISPIHTTIIKMSLFKTRELWSVTNPPNENYNSRSLALYPSEVRNFIDQLVFELTWLSYLWYKAQELLH